MASGVVDWGIEHKLHQAAFGYSEQEVAYNIYHYFLQSPQYWHQESVAAWTYVKSLITCRNKVSETLGSESRRGMICTVAFCICVSGDKPELHLIRKWICSN